jgi:protein phosphatase
MHNPTATLHCPHPSCQTLNPEGHKFCLKCGSFLPRHYLWSLDTGLLDREATPEEYRDRAGDILGDRYLLKTDKILLDTQPGLPPETPEDIPPHIAPYLKLFAHRIHVPQVYGRVSLPSNGTRQQVWLLEEAPILVDGDRVCLQPTLTDAWSKASPMRQLNWLWQIANLWSPFIQVGVASSLLNPKLLRVEGATVRVLELAEDTQTPTLSQMGQLWSRWVDSTAVPMKDFLHRLCGLLIEGRVRSAEQLISLLDGGLAVVGQSQSRRIQLVTLSDQGPSRTRNEDACYPPSGTTGKTTPETLTIVCDGVGGHEGGDVASRIAIEAISAHLQPFLNARDLVSSERLYSALENSIYDANNAISAQNNHEHRQGRQRMGTTVAIGLTHAHECYITHIGDSRAYRITSSGCYQLTLDDDVASREVRLGYALYRNALQQVAAGSLVQAIGMGSSNTLYPNINRTIVDEDCLFLFCSDGLSDYDRVEQYWQDELLPALDGRIDLAEAARKLVLIANRLNGHDNVTVAILRIQVTPVNAKSISANRLLDSLNSLPTALSPTPAQVSTSHSNSDEIEDMPTQVVIPRSTSRSSSILPAAFAQRLRRSIALFTVGLALAGAGYFAYLKQSTVRAWVDRHLGREIAVSPSPIASPPSAAVLALNGQDQIRIQTGTQLWKVLGERTKGFETVPAETILQVVNKQAIKDELWLELQVCTLPETAASPAPDEKPLENATPIPTSEAKENDGKETPSPATSSNVTETADTKASPTARPTTESKEEGANNAKPPSPASSTPKTDEKNGETAATVTPSPSPSDNDHTSSKGSETPKPRTFWIVGDELDRSGFDRLEADRTESNLCQPSPSPSAEKSDKKETSINETPKEK